MIETPVPTLADLLIKARLAASPSAVRDECLDGESVRVVLRDLERLVGKGGT
jgi:hypothetical protein